MLIMIATAVRMGIFFLMEIFCVNSLIWFYNWSLPEKYIQIILMILYIGISIVFPFFCRIKDAVSQKRLKLMAISEGIISGLVLFFILTSVNFSSINVWIILLLQIYICAMSICALCRR